MSAVMQDDASEETMVSSAKAAVKQPVSEEQRRLVLDLRRRHSLREVAEATGLPLGTVKTLVSRSGAFRDNDQHRALFTLPPIKTSTETLPSVPELPPQEDVTGDKEVDAVLWLRSIINTGQAALIERAMEAAKRIKAPHDVLEKRYRDYLIATNPGNVFAALSSFDFADLEGLAARSIEKHRLRTEGRARFGDHLFSDTPAEVFCIEALEGLKLEQLGSLDSEDAAARFKALPDWLPQTLADCLWELDYWRQLYRLRNAVDRDCSDGPPEASARDYFVFGLLAEIRPRNKDEAKAVFRHLMRGNGINSEEDEAILDNLIG